MGTMNDAFASAIKEIKPTYRDLVKSEPFRVDNPPSSVTGAGKKHPVAGVYILYEGPDRPLYVGRTRDLRRRLSDHGSSSVTRATLTVKMARIAAGKGTNYKTDRKAQTLYDEDSTFRTEFDKARARIRAMQVRYVKEDDDVRQALLEIYAAVKLDTIYNSFKTS